MTASEPFTHHRSLGGFDRWVSPSPLCQKRVEYKADKNEAAQNRPIPSISEERLKLRAIRWARLPTYHSGIQRLPQEIWITAERPTPKVDLKFDTPPPPSDRQSEVLTQPCLDQINRAHACKHIGTNPPKLRCSNYKHSMQIPSGDTFGNGPKRSSSCLGSGDLEGGNFLLQGIFRSDVLTRIENYISIMTISNFLCVSVSCTILR